MEVSSLVSVLEQCVPSQLKLKRRQLPIPIDDNKVMIMQISDACQHCSRSKNNEANNVKSWSEETFLRQYSILTKEEALTALVVPKKLLFSRLGQSVHCVGCRRSVERLFDHLKDSSSPALEPLVISTSGVLTMLMKVSLQPNCICAVFSEHNMPLNNIMDSFKKIKKSGRCVLHSMDGVRNRPRSASWLEMWESMDNTCKNTLTLINADQLHATLDTYLRKHRFCHECKNKVHRAYDILVGTVSIDPNKEKGYVPSLYAGVRKCEKKHIHVSTETEYVLHLIARAEPELQGRRERHAKTLEIAQEEVLTCLGLFLFERLQRLRTKMREEEQTWDILFHVGLDSLRRNIELAVEQKQGYSEFENVCEEIHREEQREKAKKSKRKKKKNKKKIEPIKQECESEDEDDDEDSCEECESNRSSTSVNCKTSDDRNNLNKQCSKDGGYFSAHCSGGSSREPSDVACEDGFCSHCEDTEHGGSFERPHECCEREDHHCNTTNSRQKKILYTPLEAMLDDSSCEADEIPEAEVKAWQERLGKVKEKRAELRQELLLRFKNFCTLKDAD